MLIGANSRTVAAAVDAKMREINASLPPGIEAKAVLNRTQLVNATVVTVARNLFEGALLVILVLFLMLGNFRAAIITALVIPVAMLMTASGMLQGRISANLMSLGAIDFRPDRGRRGHHHRKQLAPYRQSSKRSRSCAAAIGALIAVRYASGEMIHPLCLRPGDHHSCLPAVTDLQRRRKQDVRADGTDRHSCSCVRLRPLPYLCSRDGCDLRQGPRE